MNQNELDKMVEALRSQGLTWSQVNFTVSLVRNAETVDIATARDAIQKLMQGAEFKTLQGVAAWHRKAMPTDSALDAGRYALSFSSGNKGS